MKPTSKFTKMTGRSWLAGAVLSAAAVMLLGGCQTVRPPTSTPGPCSPGDPKAVPGQSVPDRFVPVVRGDVASNATKYQPCEVITNTTFRMGAEYDWVPDANRGKVKLWVDATAITPDGKQLLGDEIFVNANAPVEFDLTLGKGDPVGRTIVRLIDLTLREGVEAGTQIRVRLRDPGESGGWPGPTAAFGPVAVLDVVKLRQSNTQGAAEMVAEPLTLALVVGGDEPGRSQAAEPGVIVSTLGGQSVPDEFDGPSDKEVAQGGVMVFPYHVGLDASGSAGADRDVSFELFTREKAPLFIGADLSQLQKEVKPGPHAFIARIEANAPPGKYEVWAILSPYKGLKDGGKSVMFKMTVNAKTP